MKKADRKPIRTETTAKGATMNIYMVAATTKDKASGKRIPVWSGEYAEPATLNDGIKEDGRDEVTKVWKSERFTNFLDLQRNATKESRSALVKALILAISQGDALKIVELSQKLGIDLTKGLKSAAKTLIDAEVAKEAETEDETEVETDETDDESDDETTE
jgi:hypothetical protein